MASRQGTAPPARQKAKGFAAAGTAAEQEVSRDRSETSTVDAEGHSLPAMPGATAKRMRVPAAASEDFPEAKRTRSGELCGHQERTGPRPDIKADSARQAGGGVPQQAAAIGRPGAEPSRVPDDRETDIQSLPDNTAAAAAHRSEKAREEDTCLEPCGEPS